MTVGQELSRQTGFPLYYNHRLVDFLTDFFPYGSRGFNRLTGTFNKMFFEEAIAAKLAIIWTWGWWFDRPDLAEDIRDFCQPWLDGGGDVYWVELSAPLDVRVERNRSENRRAHKKVDWATDEYIRGLAEAQSSNSDGRFPPGYNHMLIDTTSLSAAETATMVCERFALGEIAKER